MDRSRHAFGELLRASRQSLGLSQREVARRAGLSLRAVRNIELGHVGRPHPGSLRRLGEVLRLSDAELHGPPPGPPEEPRLHIGVLGPLVVTRGAEVDVAGAGARRLLGLLAIQPGRPVPAEEIVDVLWSGRPPRAWLQSVNHYVWQLRGLVEPGRPRRAPARTLLRTGAGYLLDLDADQLDVLRFDAFAARAGKAAGDAPRALPLWAQALRCWRGPVLAGLGAGLHEHPAAVALAGRRLAAALAHADLALDTGGCAQAVEFLRAVAAGEPLHEGLHARLMLALAGSGEQAAALAVFAHLRTRLADELGVEPGPELREVHLRVVRNEVLPGGPPATVHIDAPGGWIPPAQLPADVTGFAGRAAPVAWLDELLATPTTAGQVVVVAGTAGVGKTSLAVHWSHRVAGRFRDGQLYVNLRGFDATGVATRPTEALNAFLDALGVPPERIPAAPDAQAGLYRSLLARRRILVVLDNARDAEQVRPLLPGAPGCLTLVTSRNQLSGLVAVDGAHPLTLDPLSPPESHAALTARLGARRLAAEPRAADEIVAHCAGLPLALVVVAARAAMRPYFPLAALADELNATPGDLDGLGGADPATDIRTVFSWSYRTLGTAAARLFRLLGLHPGPDIGAAAAASLAGLPAARARRLLAALAEAHLVVEPEPGRYALHDLLRAYAAELAAGHDSAADRRAALVRVLDHHLHTATAATLALLPHRRPIRLAPAATGVAPERIPDAPRALAWFAAECPVLLAAVERAVHAGLDAHAWRLGWACAAFLDRQARWSQLRASQQTALAAARRLADPAGQGHCHRNLGAADLETGHLDDAHRHYLRAAELFALVGAHTDQAYAHLGAAVVHDRQARHADALRHARQALELYRMDGYRAGQAHALNSIGWYCGQLGDHRQAIVHCRQAITIADELGDRSGASHTWDSLGLAHHQLGDHAEAAACYRRAIDLFRQTGDRFYTADTLGRLGDTHEATGEPDAARNAWRTALDILTDLDHPDAATVRTKLARLNHHQPHPTAPAT